MRLGLIVFFCGLLLGTALANATDYVVRDRSGRVVGVLDDRSRGNSFIVRDRFGRTVGVARPTQDGGWRGDRGRNDGWDRGRWDRGGWDRGRFDGRHHHGNRSHYLYNGDRRFR